MSQDSIISNASTHIDHPRTNQENFIGFSMIDNIEDAEKELFILSKCHCCSRHMINKPKILNPWIELPFHGTQHTSCSCNCRHIARFICRRHHT